MILASDNELAPPQAGDSSSGMPRVLVIDDDVDLTEMLNEYLGQEGFLMDVAHDGAEGLRRALSTEFSLLILDITLPKMNGLEVLRRFRAQSKCPVIMLTARGQETDRVVGLEIGADDYLPKPFSARELLARMNAVLRRTQPEPEPAPEEIIAVGDVTVDELARTVRRNGRLIELTSAEFDVLKLLLASAGKIVTREEVFEKVLHREYTVFDRSLDNYISNLRKKLGPKIGGIERIKSVRNSGYLYAQTPRPAKKA